MPSPASLLLQLRSFQVTALSWAILHFYHVTGACCCTDTASLAIVFVYAVQPLSFLDNGYIRTKEKTEITLNARAAVETSARFVNGCFSFESPVYLFEIVFSRPGRQCYPMMRLDFSVGQCVEFGKLDGPAKVYPLSSANALMERKEPFPSFKDASIFSGSYPFAFR